MADWNGHDRSQAVPLFPLPNLVLFPRAVLPLHIFEERYRKMVADALHGDRLIAMALLKPGWERDYYSRPAIEPVVCVGRILTHEQLADGKYNLLLQGIDRATIVQETAPRDLLYRTAELQRLIETNVSEIDLADQRARLREVLVERFTHWPNLLTQFEKLLNSELATAEVADLLAFNLLEDLGLKQSLLEDTDVTHRVGRVIAALEQIQIKTPKIAPRVGNPSLN